jgi:hypothetical protein
MDCQPLSAAKAESATITTRDKTTVDYSVPSIGRNRLLLITEYSL